MISWIARIGYVARDSGYLFLGLTVIKACTGLNDVVYTRLIAVLVLLASGTGLLIADPHTRSGWWRKTPADLKSWRIISGELFATFGLFSLAFWLVAVLGAKWLNVELSAWELPVGLLLSVAGIFLLLRDSPAEATTQDVKSL